MARGRAQGQGTVETAPPAPGDVPGAPANALPQRFGRNVVMNYAAQGTSALSALVMTPLLLHHLGATSFAVWVLASNVVLYLELFELGFGGAIAKLIAEDATARPEEAVRTLNTGFFALFPLGLLAMVVGVGVAFLFPVVMHVAPALHGQVVVVVLILVVGLAISIPGDVFGGALNGHQRFDLLGLSNSLLVATSFVVSIVIVELGGGLVPLAIGFTVPGILFHFVRYWMVRRIAPDTRLRLHLIDRSRLRQVMHLSGWFLLTAILQTIYNACDVVVCGIVLGLRAAALYAVASKLSAAASQGLDAMASVFFPYASSVFRNKDRSMVTDVVVDGTRAAMFVGMMVSVVFIVLATPGIHAWVGGGYGTSARVLMVLAAAIALASPVRVVTMVVMASDRLQVVSAVRGVEIAINLTLSIVLGRAIGPVGVAVGTLAGILLARIPGTLTVGTRAIGVPLARLVRGGILPHVPPVVTSAAVLYLLRGIAGHSLPQLIVSGLVGVVVYGVVYFALGATEGDRQRAWAAVVRVVPTRWRHGVGEPGTDLGVRSPE